MVKRIAVAVMVLTLWSGVAFAEDGIINADDGVLDLELVAETGFVSVLFHTIQIGSSGTVFDYVSEGGQELLSPFSRVTAELGIADRHSVIFLYQPLEIATQSRFDDDVTIDDVTFEAGQVVDLVYSFPFYRLSYLFDFVPESHLELAAGLSLQIRNASIRFESVDPATDDRELAISQNLGPVPIIKLRGEYRFQEGPIPGAFVALEADGFYASSAFINGASFDFEGSIFDVSLRAGFEPTPGFDMFLNVRTLGGGASGERGDERDTWTESREDFTDNFLTTLSVTLGARIR